ncbi:MAG TPA: F0F1 ATP synthase subunit B, partial [Dehalococcoidales bacterium]|nr:F0F1 ATP synthase subunit B [Dehalococcoidales bacterium]
MEGLGINVASLIVQLGNFILLLVLLYFVGYKPILKIFDERARKVKESLEKAETIKAEADAAEVEFKKQLETQRKEGQEIVNRAMRTGDELRKKAEQEARVEGETLVAKARSEIQRERDDAIGEIRKEFADITIAAAEKVIDRSLDK